MKGIEFKGKMMREIKFRAWDKKEKRMYSCIDKVEWLISGEVIRAFSVIHEEKTHGMMNGYNGEENFILLQYTGLKDKNGTEIFEGDILRIKETYIGDTFIKEYNGYIYFENGSFNVTGEASFDTLAVNNSYWEIIGTIYENLELVEL